MDAIRKTQLALQILAIMDADLCRPGDEEKHEILNIARIQIDDLRQISKMTAAQEQASSARHCSS
jgi:hypothetical protein